MLDIASQIYIVCAAIGSIYLVVGLIMGQLHGHGDAGVGQGDHGFGTGDHGFGHVHGDAGLAHGHGLSIGHGHGPAIGHAQGPAIGHGHGPTIAHDHGTAIGHGQGDPGAVHGHGTAAGHDAGAGHPSESSQSSSPTGIGKHLEPHVDISATGGHHVLGSHPHADHGPVQLMERKRFKILRFLQTILSPMTIAVFLAYFGICGLLLARMAPFLGPFVPIAAIIASLLITGRVLQLLRWMVFKMNVSTVVRMDDMIGHQAEIITPIKGEREGEITYWTGSTMMQSPAKSATAGAVFKRGDKVMICDIREGTAYVEPWSDISLDASAVIETKETLKEEQDA